MKLPPAIVEKFYEGHSTDLTKFGVNADVQVIGGPHKGKLGSVISIEGLDPNPKYLIEMKDGSSIVVEEPFLQAL